MRNDRGLAGRKAVTISRSSAATSLALAISLLGTNALAGCGRALPNPSYAGLTAASIAASGCTFVRAARPYAPAYANTTWPSEHHGPWRTHAVGEGLRFKAGEKLLAKSASLPPTPVWGYVGQDGNVYVTGGAPYALDVFTKLILGAPQSSIPQLLAKSLLYSRTVTPYLAKIDPTTLQSATLSLTRGTSVNYIGGALVDANGYIYVDARGILYKIDPRTFSIVRSQRLPLAPSNAGRPNELTAYNGMQATTGGDLILKGFASAGGDTGVLVRVDPGDLSIDSKFESTQLAAARMVVATDAGKQYVYVPGATDSIRILIGSSGFTLDSAYSQQYLVKSSGDSPASSDAFMGRGVVFANNTEPQATTPMRIFAQGASDGSVLAPQAAFSATTEQWNFFMVAGDPFESGIVAVQNQVDGHISGFRICGGGTSVEKLWENDSIDGSSGMAIDDATGQLYADDHRCNAKICTLSFVVLDLKTGKELGRTRVAGTEPSIGQIFIAPHGRAFYLATETDKPNGYITRITVEPKTR